MVYTILVSRKGPADPNMKMILEGGYQDMKRSRRILSYVALAVACVMIGSGITMGLNNNTAAAESTTVVYTSPFTAAIAQVRDSVVGVSNYQTVRSSSYGNGYGNFGFGYGYGFGNGGNGGNGNNEITTTEKLYATGSGTVIATGYVLTNYHVVEDASSLKVTVSHDDGSDADEYDAELVAYDETLDIAILYSADLPLDPVTLGDSDSLQVGDWAIVIGNPLSETFSGTVTAGIVSGLNREISSSSSTTDRYGLKTTKTNTMIQIDAAINSGNSGGGMFSVTGELMGIPTLKYSSSGSSTTASIESIGMCIPINSCKELINKVLSGEITSTSTESTSSSTTSGSIDMTGKPRMGISMNSMSSSGYSSAVSAGYLPNGVLVHTVEEDSPAAKAGIQPYDIIVDVNGTAITSASQIQQLVAACNAGDTLQVKIYRVENLENAQYISDLGDGEYIDVEVTLAVVDSL